MPVNRARGAEMGGGGQVLRALGRGNRLTESLSTVSLFRLVNKYGKLLGHAKLETTVRYLDLELNMETTVSDFVPYENGP